MRLNIIHLFHRTDRWKLLMREITEQEITKYKIWSGIIDESLPCRGISQAHKQIVKDAKKNKLPEVLIGEDDLHFTAPGAFDFFLRNKPSDYDIYLGGIVYGKIMEDNTVDDFSGNTLYLVNERFYDTILSVPEEYHLDRALKCRGKFIVSNPFVVIPQNGYSDNHKREFNYLSYLKGRKLFGE
jgi:hypothetical protein